MSHPTAARRILRSSALIAVGTACSRASGFVRLATIAAVLGFTRLTDAYNLANESPNMVYELLIGGVLTAVLVPTFVTVDEDNDHRGRAAVFGTTLLALAIITGIAVLLAPVLAALTTLRVDASLRALERAVVTDLMRFLLLEIFFYGWFALLAAALNARRRFVAAAFAPALNNVVVVGLFLGIEYFVNGSFDLASRANDDEFLLWLGLGTATGIVVMTLALLPAARRAGIPLRTRIAPRDPAVKRLIRLSGWTLGYVVANQVALWVVLILAAREAGGVSAYLGAFLFFMFPYGLLAVSITTAIAPELVTATRSDDHAALSRIYSMGARLVVLTMALAAAVFVPLGRPIVQAALSRGAFSGSAASLTASTLVGLSVGLPAFALYLYSLRLFYARQNTRTPFWCNLVQNAVAIVLAIAFAARWGVPGIAWAIAFSYVVAAAVTLVVAHRTVGTLGGRSLVAGIVRPLVAAVGAGAAAFGVRTVVDNAWAAVALGTAVAVAVFLGVLVALRGDELALARSLRRRPSAAPSPADVTP